jgi:predicted RNase H-like HicB family nuclease
MNYSIVYERVEDGSLPSGFFYAHVPAFDLTTQGEGIDGARAAAQELLTLWIAEKWANNEPLPIEHEIYLGRVEIADAPLSA